MKPLVKLSTVLIMLAVLAAALQMRGSASQPRQSGTATAQATTAATARATATAAATARATVPVSAADAALWARLRQGSGYVILMRHALAPGTGDPANFRVDECSTQRNLSEEGRQQAVQIGRVFREQNIPVARVLSSQWCRCLETARLMNIGTVEPFTPINSLFGERISNEPQQSAQVRKFIVDNRNIPGVIVMVSHQTNISAITRITTQSGAAVIVRANAAGEIEVIGELNP